jgi:hypothetical protein
MERPDQSSLHSFHPSIKHPKTDMSWPGFELDCDMLENIPPSVRERLARLSRENKQLKAKVGNIGWS